MKYASTRKCCLNSHIYENLVTIVEGDPKAHFSIATTPRCWSERYSFLWIAPYYP